MSTQIYKFRYIFMKQNTSLNNKIQHFTKKSKYIKQITITTYSLLKNIEKDDIIFI